MLVDVARLALGLGILAFHRPLADFVLHHEAHFVARLRQRGLHLPALSRATAHNIYFMLGMFVAVLSLCRLWLALQ